VVATATARSPELAVVLALIAPFFSSASHDILLLLVIVLLLSKI
jgi:hypothetical protein